MLSSRFSIETVVDEQYVMNIDDTGMLPKREDQILVLTTNHGTPVENAFQQHFVAKGEVIRNVFTVTPQNFQADPTIMGVSQYPRLPPTALATRLKLEPLNPALNKDSQGRPEFYTPDTLSHPWIEITETRYNQFLQG